MVFPLAEPLLSHAKPVVLVHHGKCSALGKPDSKENRSVTVVKGPHYIKRKSAAGKACNLVHVTD